MKRNHTKILSVTLTAALIGSLLAIPTAEAATKKLKVTAPKTVAVNSTIKIKTNVKCKFKSSNKKIATVNSKGVVKGKKAGKVKITVTAKKGKQKKTLKITVKKNAKEGSNKTPSTAVPGVSTTQSPQVDVTQSPKPPEEASQTPSVPGKSSDPATESPDIPKTPNPPTLTPDVPASETPSVTSTPGPIGTETPDVPKTPGPSVTSEPTSTATPSPTNPSQTKQPIGITAEFEGKLPVNNTTSNEYTTMDFVNKMSVVVTVKYDDNTQRNLNFDEFLLDEGKIVEESSKKYVEQVVTYKEFSTILRVEIVEVDSDILYPYTIMCDYIGGIIQKGKVPDPSDIVVNAIYDVDQIKEVSTGQLRIDFIEDLYETEGVKKYQFRLSYNYYFEFNGEKLHTCPLDSIYVPYE